MNTLQNPLAKITLLGQPLSRAFRTIHIENQFLHPHSPIHLVNPLAAHVRQCVQILRLG